MVNLLQFKHKYCKKYSDDIWGFVLSQGKYDKLGKFLSNEYRRRSRQRRRSKSYKELLDDQKKIRLFYGGIKMVAYKRYRQNNSLIACLECRLSMIVYRLNFVTSIGQGIHYAKNGYFLVNNEVITDANYMIKVGDVVQVDPYYREKLYQNYELRLQTRFFPLAYPKYLEVNYQIMAGILLYKPVYEDVYYPFIVGKISFENHYIS